MVLNVFHVERLGNGRKKEERGICGEKRKEDEPELQLLALRELYFFSSSKIETLTLL